MSAPPIEVGNCLRPTREKYPGCRGKHPNPLCRIRERGFYLSQQLGQRLSFGVIRRYLLGLKRRQLRGRELLALRIAQNPINRTRNMAQVEGYGRQAQRQGVNFEVGQPGGPLGQIVESQIERMQHRAAHGRNFGMGSRSHGSTDGTGYGRGTGKRSWGSVLLDGAFHAHHGDFGKALFKHRGLSFSPILRITSSLTERSRLLLRSRQTSSGTSKNTPAPRSQSS